ncbi:MAG: tripartite tricarboxylate transporter permease [Anaerolineae bacterium]|nr:tripartite tricarboxylate transporter permease [Anaerolineae bacterium]
MFSASSQPSGADSHDGVANKRGIWMITLPEFLRALLFAFLGALVAAPLSLLPAIHIYNIAGFLLMASVFLGPFLAPEEMAMLFLGMVTAYSVLNTIPSVFFSAPDESMVFVVLPGQKYLMQGRGYEAAVLTGIGSLAGSPHSWR